MDTVRAIRALCLLLLVLMISKETVNKQDVYLDVVVVDPGQTPPLRNTCHTIYRSCSLLHRCDVCERSIRRIIGPSPAPFWWRPGGSPRATLDDEQP